MTNFVDMNPKASTPASSVAGPVPLMAYLVIVSMFSNLKKSETFKVYRRNRFRIFSNLNADCLVGQAKNFWVLIWVSNSNLEFGPKYDYVPSLGALGQCFTTLPEARRRTSEAF